MPFPRIEAAPPDAILGLSEAYRNDPNPEKINLGVGVYQDDSGKTPVLKSVRQAALRVVEQESTKTYLPIDGTPELASVVQQLLLGKDHPVIAARRAATSHTPGGTGGLRVAADFIHTTMPKAKVWLTDPTWPNHPNIFAAAGVPTATYPHFDRRTNGLDFAAAREAIAKMPAGDVILLHGCCHNPTGIDPTPQQWKEIADLIVERQLIPLVDFAYQGFGEGIEEDAAGLREVCREGVDLLVCSSFSKNFGLYRERVGAFTVIATTPQLCANAQSQVKRVIRANYSNPPAHGANIVTTILSDPALIETWQQELGEMRNRIHEMRNQLVNGLTSHHAKGDFSFIQRQNGMFSFSGLNPEQVANLREQFSIYIVGSGRINVAGITSGNVDRLCSAIAQVVK